MNADQQIWQLWATKIQRWGIMDWALTFFEATSPFHLIGAQFIYIGGPFIDWLIPENHLRALSNLLEDPARAQEFISFIKADA